jgi:hypothetical protein
MRCLAPLQAVLLTLWVAGPAQAQAGGTYHLSVSIADNRGRSIPNLTAADISVRLDDRQATVTQLAVDPRPLSIVIAMDGLVAEEALQARAALSSMLRQLRTAEGTRVGLMLGRGGASAPTMYDATTDAGALANQVSRFFQSEVTAPPQDLLVGATEALAREENRRRVVLLASVNRRTGRVQIPQALITSMREHAVTLVALDIATSVSGAAQDPALQLIANAAGGIFERLADVTALQSASSRFLSTVLTAYLVTFTVDGPLTGQLDVRVRTQPRATVVAPHWAVVRR